MRVQVWLIIFKRAAFHAYVFLLGTHVIMRWFHQSGSRKPTEQTMRLYGDRVGSCAIWKKKNAASSTLQTQWKHLSVFFIRSEALDSQRQHESPCKRKKNQLSSQIYTFFTQSPTQTQQAPCGTDECPQHFSGQRAEQLAVSAVFNIFCVAFAF